MDLIVGTLSQTAVLSPLIISLSLIFRVSGVVNFGAGFFVVFAGSAAAAWDGPGGLAAAVMATAALGAVAYGVAIVPARRRGVPAIGLTLSTLGAGLLIGWFTRDTFGAGAKAIDPWIAGGTEVLGTRVPNQRLAVIALSAVLLLALYVLFDRTVLGRTLSAVAYDDELAAMYGVHGSRLQLVAWCVAGVCMALAGVFQASLASTSVEVAPTLLVFSLIGAVVGGLGSLAGSVGGALIVSLGITGVSLELPGVHTLTVAFLVLFVVLMVRPRGLLSSGPVAERV